MDIPEELVTEILVRLPVKSLLKFRKVCKSWDGVIKSPEFADMHLKHPSQKSRTEYMVISKHGVLKFYSRDDKDGGLIPLANPNNFPLSSHTYLRIRGPCNGIICIVGYKSHLGYTAFYLCNPATRQFRRIPNSPLALECPNTDFRDFSAQGFGFDPRTNEYKVVSVMYCYTENEEDNHGTYTIEIYEVRSNCWRKVETVFPEAMVEFTQDSDRVQFCSHRWSGIGLLFNGCLHWRFGWKGIFTFDISNEVVRHIPGPPKDDEDMMNMYSGNLVVFADCLAQVKVATSGQEGFASVWVMTEYGVQESWSKTLSIPLTSNLVCTAKRGHLIPVSCWNNDMLVFNDRVRKLLVTCNLSGDDYQFKDAADEEAGFWVGAAIIRDESLVSVHSETEKTQE